MAARNAKISEQEQEKEEEEEFYSYRRGLVKPTGGKRPPVGPKGPPFLNRGSGVNI